MRSLNVLSLLALSLAFACSSSSSEPEGVPSFTPPGSSAGSSAGSSGNQAANAGTSANTSTPVGSGGSSGNTNSNSSEGQGGSVALANGGNTGMQGGGNGASPAGAASGGASNASAGASGSPAATGGSGGASGQSVVGRVGADLCPAGPFDSPLPANPTATKIVSLPMNNFNTYNWEGVVWIGDSLYWSEIDQVQNPPTARINKFTPPSTFTEGFIQNTGSNGLATDAQGNIIAATHDVGAISVFALPGGARSQFGGSSAQTFMGKRFDSPNDLVLRGDGNLYFSDPNFQAPNPQPQSSTSVYRISPSGVVSVVDSLSNPNGVTLSPDGNILYVDAGDGALRSYAVAADGSTSAASMVPLSNGSLQTPDGMGMDCAGNIYVVENGAKRIRVLKPDGTEIGRIQNADGGGFGQSLTNVAFGGPDHKTLFISGFVSAQSGGLYSIDLNVPGFPY